MVLFSKLRRFELIDAQQKRARLHDLAIALEDDYPPVTHLFFLGNEKQDLVLAWDAVISIDWEREKIKVADLGAAKDAGELLGQAVLLRRDVLDALLLNLQNRSMTRANDLVLKEEDGVLRLCAADTSVRAMLRRLSHGRLGAVRDNDLYDWKYLEFLRGDPLAVRSGAGYRMRIRLLPVGEIAHLSNLLPYPHAAELLALLPDQQAADTLEGMRPERRLQVFGVLEEGYARRILELTTPDIAADLVGRLEPETAERYLNEMQRPRAQRIVELLRYPEETVGGIMVNDVVCAPADWTVREAREKLRVGLKEADFINFIYIVNNEEERHLRGVVTVRGLLISEDQSRLEELMNPYVVTLYPLDAAQEAAYRVLQCGLAALPVVGREGQLLGAVTVDAAVAQVAPPHWAAQVSRVFS